MIPALISALGARRLFQYWPLPALAAVCLAAAAYIPIGGDFYWYYYRVPQDWLAGETRLYDAASRGYFLPPWGIWPYLPLALLDAPLAGAIANVLSIAIIGSIAYQQARGALPEALEGRRGGSTPVLSRTSRNAPPSARAPLVVALLAALCPYSLVLYLTGTPDAWSLLGLWIAWLSVRAGPPKAGWGLGAGAALALVRPQNCLLTLPALLLRARRGHGAQALLPGSTGPPKPGVPLVQAGAVLALVLLASFVVSGPDWPLRWWENYFIRPPAPEGAATTYSALQRLGIPLWLSGLVGLAVALYALRWASSPGAQASCLPRPGVSPGLTFRFEVLVALNAVITPFIRSPGYVLLLAIPWVGLAVRRPWLAAGVYGISLPTILVPLWWEGLAPFWPYIPFFDLLFPIGLTGALLCERQRSLRLDTPARNDSRSG